MHYFVLAEDGQKYGPADVATLNQWAQQGRVGVATMLEDAATGQQLLATNVAGIVFPIVAPSAQYGPQSNYPRGNVGPGGAWSDNGAGDLRTAWTFAIIGIFAAFVLAFCCPLLGIFNIFSILGIVYSNNAKKKGNLETKGAMTCSIIGFILAIIIAGGMGAFFAWMS